MGHVIGSWSYSLLLASVPPHAGPPRHWPLPSLSHDRAAVTNISEVSDAEITPLIVVRLTEIKDLVMQ
jgi:hypothetical protein